MLFPSSVKVCLCIAFFIRFMYISEDPKLRFNITLYGSLVQNIDHLIFDSLHRTVICIQGLLRVAQPAQHGIHLWHWYCCVYAWLCYTTEYQYITRRSWLVAVFNVLLWACLNLCVQLRIYLYQICIDARRLFWCLWYDAHPQHWIVHLRIHLYAWTALPSMLQGLVLC